ncbi:MAG: ATP-dependent RecD-like DNA helicase, partial [Desulfobacteraceae bacterium]
MNHEPETILLTGRIEKITYTSEETGYAVAKVIVQGRKDPVTVVGNLLSPVPGETLTMKGEWTKHPKFGEQFKVSEFSSAAPESLAGIEKYLGSGIVKGIGPVMAERIVKKFGIKTLDIIEKDTFKLSSVEGIGEKRIAMIKKAWDEQKEIRNLMIFIHAYGLGAGYAVKIFRKYGNRAMAVMKENPYRLAVDISGIGFITADSIGAKLGFSKDSKERVESGIVYALFTLSEEGHVYYPLPALIENCAAMLDVEREDVKKGIDAAAASGKIVIEELAGDIEKTREEGRGVFLVKYHYCEAGISKLLKIIVDSAKSFRNADPEKAIEWVQHQLSITLAGKQSEAVRRALNEKVLVITGGPGTGKTTIINAILKIFKRLGKQILLAAPTGRAAKRMSEATGFAAKTIHRMLEYNPEKGGFQRNENNPLECNLLIVDEASMIDTLLMFSMLKAVPPETALILVGDVNQLPSVGAGNVLCDVIESDLVPVVTLTEIFRQAKESRIVINAHRINSGEMPLWKADEKSSDFYFIEQENPERIIEIIRDLVTERIPKRFGFDPIDEIQVLTPMHRGVLGSLALNEVLQEALNPGEALLVRGEKKYKTGDKVMQVRNNYEKDVFNGDIGRIKSIDSGDQKMVVSFEGRHVEYDFHELDDIILSYAVSVHKSQGSEYPAIVMPVHTQHYMLLQRNLIYTALTRGRRLVVMVGTKKALAIGISNNRTQK